MVPILIAQQLVVTNVLRGEAMRSLKIMAAIILGLLVGFPAPALVAGYQKKLPDSYDDDRQLLRLTAVEDFPVYKPRRPSPPLHS